MLVPSVGIQGLGLLGSLMGHCFSPLGLKFKDRIGKGFRRQMAALGKLVGKILLFDRLTRPARRLPPADEEESPCVLNGT